MRRKTSPRGVWPPAKAVSALRERLHCTIALRGNRLTLGGDDQHVVAARAVVDELVELVEGAVLHLQADLDWLERCQEELV